MPEEQATPLRIYCRCGQKMRVSEAMFGRSAKCVACKLKIRIPKREDLPSDITELDIRDHPELVRDSERASQEAPEHKAPKAAAEAAEEVPAARPKSHDAAIDVLEPLRILCSLEWKLEHRIKRAGEGATGETATQALEARKKRLRKARSALEEDLRQRLMEVAIELASAQDKLSEASLAVRVGELSYQEFRDQVARLRRRRDCLEKRQINLRVWLTVRDPYLAGGYADVPFDALNMDHLKATVHDEMDETLPLIEWQIENLRDALALRQESERRLGELERLEKRGDVTESHAKRVRAEHRALRKRAKAGVAFWRGRLEQANKEYAGDIEAIEAQLELARGRRQMGEIDRVQFEEAEGELRKAKIDLVKARDLVARALTANTAGDVPAMRGSFLMRLAPMVSNEEALPDKWLAWGAALILILALFLPVLGSDSAFSAALHLREEAPGVLLLLVGPLLGGALLAFSSYLTRRDVRGVAALTLCVLLAVGAVGYFHEGLYDPGAVGDELRNGGAWFLRSGGLVFIIGLAVMAATGSLALLREKGVVRAFLPAAAAVLVLGVAALGSDFAGLLSARAPVIGVTQRLAADAPGRYEVDITVANVCNRVVRLAARPGARGAYGYRLEHQVGTRSWRPVPAPAEATAAGVPVAASDNRGAIALAIPSGSQATLPYTLAPGEYRVVIQAPELDQDFTAAFSLPEIGSAAPEAAAPAGPPEGEAPPSAESEGEAATTTPEEDAPGQIEIELRGVAHSEGKRPLFSITLYFPGGQSKQRDLAINETVIGDWKVKEFNPAEQTVTLDNGERILVLRSGERKPLEAL